MFGLRKILHARDVKQIDLREPLDSGVVVGITSYAAVAGDCAARASPFDDSNHRRMPGNHQHLRVANIERAAVGDVQPEGPERTGADLLN